MIASLVRQIDLFDPEAHLPYLAVDLVLIDLLNLVVIVLVVVQVGQVPNILVNCVRGIRLLRRGRRSRRLPVHHATPRQDVRA